jgi:hypothetical protein
MLKLSRAGLGLALLSVCSLFSACNNNDPLKDFVEQDVKLDVKAAGSQVLGTGKLNFTEVSYSTSYRTVCDHYECGGYETRCYGGGTYCSGGHQVCSGGRQVCTPVRRCTGSGCTTDSVCHTESGGCHTEGQYCRTEPRDCRNEYVSRTCSTNCRNEPYQIRHETKIPSAVTVTLKGVADAGAVQGLHLGVKSGSRFIQAFENASMRPKGYEYLWNGLASTDKTLLVSASKGVKLSAGQTFLTLPSGFKPGDAVNVEALFEPSGSQDAQVSAVGTSVDFPALSFDR